MSLESGTFIDDLDVTNPPTTDPKSQGDDHIRLIKEVLKNTFPNADKPFRFPDADGGGDADLTIDENSDNFTWFADTSGGAVTVHPPSLDGSRYGFRFYVCKTTTDRNPVFFQSGSNNIYSGEYGPYSKIRRGFPNVIYSFFWDGSNWRCPRHPGVPIGALVPFAIDYDGDPPVGYEWPNGQTLNTDNYPEYADQREAGTTPDLRGRVPAGRDNMGGSSSDRLNGADGGVDGDGFENTGGAEQHQLAYEEMPSHWHDGTSDDENQNHTHDQIASASVGSYSGGGSTGPLGAHSQTGPNNRGHTHTFTTNSAGEDAAHNNVQPTIIENYVLVVE